MFFKEDVQMAKKHIRRFEASLIIGEMQTETTMKYHLTPIRMATVKKNGKQQLLARMQKNWNPYALFVGI